MSIKKTLNPLLIIIFTHLLAFGVSFPNLANNNFNFVKNLDPVLINGKKYLFYPINVIGHQFLNSHDFEKGNVIINGVLYEDLLLNLDIYNQELVLRFTTLQGSVQQISMSDAWITNFSIGKDNFEYRTMEDGSKRIFQIFGSGNIKIIYSWEKTLRLNSSSGKHYFSKPAKKSFLLIDREICAFKNNRSFIKCFDENYRFLIRKYLKESKIKVSRLNDTEIESLTNYCNIIYKN